VFFNNLDCNDHNANLTTNTTEVCNGKDDNCNGEIDEGFAPVTATDPFGEPIDADGDGFYVYSSATCAAFYGAFDCNDNNKVVNPNAAAPCSCACDISAPLTPCNDTGLGVETCDGLDNNCDGIIDEGLFLDVDGDGWGSPSIAIPCCPNFNLSCPGFACNADCDDQDPSVFPCAPDLPCSGADNSCGAFGTDLSVLLGLSDNDNDSHYTFPPLFPPSATDLATCLKNFPFPIDDCDDANARKHPGLSETDPRFRGNGTDGIYGDGLDNDCNGIIDDIIRDFVQFSFNEQLLALPPPDGEVSRHDGQCVPNYALIFTLFNLANRSDATNVVIKGKIDLFHGARLALSVLGDLTAYGIKLDTHTGAVTWVQFSIPNRHGNPQLVAIPLCLEHDSFVHGFLNVTFSDQNNYDLFFGLQFDKINF